MNRRLLKTTIAVTHVLALAWPAWCVSATLARSARPNIIFILADDLGWSELGCHGNRFNETPYLDRLASGGLRFTSAYAAAPVCSPTRAAFMTGQHPARTGITNYLRADDEKYLSPDYHTLAEALQSAGYATGLIGKWHLMGDYALKRGDPSRHGFAEIICSETRYIGGGDYFGPYDFMPDVQPLVPDEYLTDRLNSEAITFIKRHHDRPFFLYLSHYAVHTKLAARAADIAHFETKAGAGQRRNNPTLAAMLGRIDTGVGNIMAALRELGIEEHTLLVFTSDNGGEHRVTSNAPLRGHKSQLYEGGIRVPLVFSWPGTIQPAGICDLPVTTMDFYPTFLNVAGAKGRPEQITDGITLLPLIHGKKTTPRRTLYWHYPLTRPHFLGGRSSSAVRQEYLKLIEFYDTGQLELYDLRHDIGEKEDLARQMPEQTRRLQTLLKDFRSSIEAKSPPVSRGSGEPDR